MLLAYIAVIIHFINDNISTLLTDFYLESYCNLNIIWRSKGLSANRAYI